MKNVKSFLKKHWFAILLGAIIVLAFVLRFYSYNNRWALSSDQARDALIGQEILRQHKIPMLGQFSQAGSFVMGPVWFWLVALATLLYPPSLLTPWVVLTLSYVFIVYLMFLIGKELGGKWLGLIIGLFTAISPGQVSQSVNLTNPSGIGIIAPFAVYFTIRYIKTGRNLFLFLFSFFIAIAINIHLQATGLLVLFPIAFILKRPKFKNLFLFLVGLILPFVPLIFFDLTHNFYDSRSMIDYLMYGQFNIYVPNRWLTYTFEYWPKTWARIIGGEVFLGYISMVLLSVISVYSLIAKKINRQTIAIIVSFLLIFIQLRYYRGIRFDSYIMFLNSLVLVLAGWMVFRIFKANRFIGLLLILLFVVFSLKAVFYEIKTTTNYRFIQAEGWTNLLIKTYPDKKFAIYDYGYRSSSFSLPLVLYLYKADKIKDDGYKIGFGGPPEASKLLHPEIKGNKFGFELRDLNNSSSVELRKEGWAFVNPSEVYKEVVEWYFGKKL
ncbi:MAG: hypothetical protein ABH816_02315 [Candidatus Levyibacteriota bacterium]